MAADPSLRSSSGSPIPQLAFGLYKVPADEEGERIIRNAVKAGYRHFDTASYYGNEGTLGRALRRTGLPREDFFLVSKIWNEDQKDRASVRQSVLGSVEELDFGGYFDLFLIHWPVPGRFVETYKELELIREEGKLRHLGISNFSPAEYEELLAGGATVKPAVNQFEVSPFMYRPGDVEYFQLRDVLVSASKSLHRAGGCLADPLLGRLSREHSATPAQVMLRWGVQKGLVVVSKTSHEGRMRENRALFGFSLSDEDMRSLDSLTTDEDIDKRTKLEVERKRQM